MVTCNEPLRGSLPLKEMVKRALEGNNKPQFGQLRSQQPDLWCVSATVSWHNQPFRNSLLLTSTNLNAWWVCWGHRSALGSNKTKHNAYKTSIYQYLLDLWNLQAFLAFRVQVHGFFGIYFLTYETCRGVVVFARLQIHAKHRQSSLRVPKYDSN